MYYADIFFVLQFPVCEDDEAIAVSCLNLYYSVKFKAKKALKDEKKDQTAPIVLSNITEQDSDSETEEGEWCILSLSLFHLGLD